MINIFRKIFREIFTGKNSASETQKRRSQRRERRHFQYADLISVCLLHSAARSTAGNRRRARRHAARADCHERAAGNRDKAARVDVEVVLPGSAAER